MKSVEIGSFFWSVFSRIRTEYRKNPVFGHFSRSVHAVHLLTNFHLIDSQISLTDRANFRCQNIKKHW